MDDYKEGMKNELITQFRGKPYLEALMEVLGQELNAVIAFYEQLRNERDLNTAKGVQLDGIGQIVGMTRREAANMVEKSFEFVTTDDDEYRKYLIYKILKNTCDCTYTDLMKALGMFWSGENVLYREDPNIPATVILRTEGFSSPETILELTKMPIIRAAGVSVVTELETEIAGDIFIGITSQQSVDAVYTIEEFEIYFELVDEENLILLDEMGDTLVDAELLGG